MEIIFFRHQSAFLPDQRTVSALRVATVS